MSKQICLHSYVICYDLQGTLFSRKTNIKVWIGKRLVLVILQGALGDKAPRPVVALTTSTKKDENCLFGDSIICHFNSLL